MRSWTEWSQSGDPEPLLPHSLFFFRCSACHLGDQSLPRLTSVMMKIVRRENEKHLSRSLRHAFLFYLEAHGPCSASCEPEPLSHFLAYSHGFAIITFGCRLLYYIQQTAGLA